MQTLATETTTVNQQLTLVVTSRLTVRQEALLRLATLRIKIKQRQRMVTQRLRPRRLPKRQLPPRPPRPAPQPGEEESPLCFSQTKTGLQ